MDIAGDLRARTRGQVLAPRDGGYEAARAAYNALATGQPAYIFRPADVPDIVAAVRWAGEVDLPIGVRGGGHSVAGHSSPDGALLVVRLANGPQIGEDLGKVLSRGAKGPDDLCDVGQGTAHRSVSWAPVRIGARGVIDMIDDIARRAPAQANMMPVNSLRPE